MSDLTGPPLRRPFLAGPRLLVALVVLCLLLAGATAYAWYRGANPDAEAPAPGAITSVAARESGLEVAAPLTEQVLSYDWRTLDADVEAARAVMAPGFGSEYGRTMAGVKAQTVENQVSIRATAVASSVVSATERKVVALVFVNQVTTAKGTAARRSQQNRVLVTLTRGEGEWRVSRMDSL